MGFNNIFFEPTCIASWLINGSVTQPTVLRNPAAQCTQPRKVKMPKSDLAESNRADGAWKAPHSSAPTASEATVRPSFPSTTALQPRRQNRRMHDFTYQGTYYPLGFAVRVTSNSDAILHAAQQSWGSLKPMFPHDPLEIRLGVRKN